MRVLTIKLLALAAAVFFVVAAPASASFGIAAFDGSVEASPAGGDFTQAGGHPYTASTTFEINQTVDSTGVVAPDGGSLKTVQVDLPPGLVGSPKAVGTCPLSVFLEVSLFTGDGYKCPTSSQVGVATPKIALGSSTAVFPPLPLYSLQPSRGAVASFGFLASQVPIFLDAYLRSEDGYHVQVVVRDTSEAIAVLGSSVILWGVPADPSHDQLRACPDVGFNMLGCPTERSSPPFLTLPTACTPTGQGLETRLRADSWSNPGIFADAHFESHNSPGFTFGAPLSPSQWGFPQGPTGCDGIPFDPTISFQPTTHQPDSPAGLDVDLSIPSEGLLNPIGISQAHLRKVVVTLPEGMTISPSAADGLAGCSDAQIGIGRDAPVDCPQASKIGTVTATTPLLEEALEGAVYVGNQNSNDPESGQMFRIFLVLKDEKRGIVVKLSGQVRADTETGRLETSFDNNPQFPLGTLKLRLKGGPRAPLATPPTCGPKAIVSRLTSWSGKVVERVQTIDIDCPGVHGFNPLLKAGMVNPVGGTFSPFVVRIDRNDREQYLKGLTVEMPTGILARLRGVPLCPETQAAAGTCNPGSRVGAATVGAGPGGSPFFLKNQPVYLAGPYKGAPYSLSVAAHAIAGPFDLGVVVVRQALYVDPVDAHIVVVSDDLPTTVKGVPLRLRSINVDIDRPGFTINPTSCADKEIKTTFRSEQAGTSVQGVRFQAGDCPSLGFSPRLAMRLTGKSQTTDGKHPGLKAELTQPVRQAGIRSVTVKLPLSLALDPANAASDALCEFEEGQKANPKCPRSSIIGKARAITPLLNRPLVGNVYFVKNVRIDKKSGRRIRTLPTLLLALRGEVAINVRAQTSIVHNKLVSTFPAIPDAPVGRFDLALTGGKKGILVVTNGQDMCRRKQKASISIAAHNGKHITRSISVGTPCKT